MATITLISDLGSKNHNLARFRQRLKREIGGSEFELVTADITRHDVGEAAFVLDSVLDEFEEDTVHIIDVESDMHALGPALAARVKNQWVIAANNGMLSLVRDGLDGVWMENQGWSEKGGTFTLMNTFIPLAQHLILKGSAGLKKAGEIREKAGLTAVITEDSLRGTVIFTDDFGNAVTNITREDFERAIQGRKMQIRLNRNASVNAIQESFGAVSSGELVCTWTSNGYLQVSLNHGHAARLLGLEKNKMVTISFE